MVEMTEAGSRIVEALVSGPVAWQSPEELALATGLGLDQTTDLIATLDVDGWISAWERPADVVVTLSVAGASWLGVRLVENGLEETLRWVRMGDPEPRSPRTSGVFRSERAASLEMVVDPSGTAEEQAQKAEETLLRCVIPSDPRERVLIEGLPRPTLLIGVGLSPWPGPGDGQKASCPCCGSNRLGPLTYCLHCDRWGLDHLLRDEPAPVPRETIRRDAKEEARRRDLERQARKAKRRARLVVQGETEKRHRRRARPSHP